jgi:hypothetical protein
MKKKLLIGFGLIALGGISYLAYLKISDLGKEIIKEDNFTIKVDPKSGTDVPTKSDTNIQNEYYDEELDNALFGDYSEQPSWGAYGEYH